MAYNGPGTIKDINTLPDGSVSLVIEIVGNAGEPPVSRSLVPGNMTNLQIRNWVDAFQQELNGKRTTRASFVVGQTFASTPAAAPTAAQINENEWREKAQRVLRWRYFQTLGFTNAAADTAIAALLADVNASAQAAYVTKLI
jgi:hypothetical protein